MNEDEIPSAAKVAGALAREYFLLLLQGVDEPWARRGNPRQKLRVAHERKCQVVAETSVYVTKVNLEKLADKIEAANGATFALAKEEALALEVFYETADAELRPRLIEGTAEQQFEMDAHLARSIRAYNRGQDLERYLRDRAVAQRSTARLKQIVEAPSGVRFAMPVDEDELPTGLYRFDPPHRHQQLQPLPPAAPVDVPPAPVLLQADEVVQEGDSSSSSEVDEPPPPQPRPQRSSVRQQQQQQQQRAMMMAPNAVGGDDTAPPAAAAAPPPPMPQQHQPAAPSASTDGSTGAPVPPPVRSQPSAAVVRQPPAMQSATVAITDPPADQPPPRPAQASVPSTTTAEDARPLEPTGQPLSTTAAASTSDASMTTMMGKSPFCEWAPHDTLHKEDKAPLAMTMPAEYPPPSMYYHHHMMPYSMPPPPQSAYPYYGPPPPSMMGHHPQHHYPPPPYAAVMGPYVYQAHVPPPPLMSIQHHPYAPTPSSLRHHDGDQLVGYPPAMPNVPPPPTGPLRGYSEKAPLVAPSHVGNHLAQQLFPAADRTGEEELSADAFAPLQPTTSDIPPPPPSGCGERNEGSSSSSSQSGIGSDGAQRHYDEEDDGPHLTLSTPTRARGHGDGGDAASDDDRVDQLTPQLNRLSVIEQPTATDVAESRGDDVEGATPAANGGKRKKSAINSNRVSFALNATTPHSRSLGGLEGTGLLLAPENDEEGVLDRRWQTAQSFASLLSRVQQTTPKTTDKEKADVARD